MMIRILYQTRNYWMTMTTYSGYANVPESTYVLKAKTFCPHSDPMIQRGFWPISTLLNYFCRFMFRVNTGSGFPFKLWGPSPFLQCQRFLNKVFDPWLLLISPNSNIPKPVQLLESNKWSYPASTSRVRTFYEVHLSNCIIFIWLYSPSAPHKYVVAEVIIRG